jgi:ketosteroid isomerase-like protein
MTNSKQNIETVRRFLTFLEQENIPAFLDLFAPDGIQLNPYASGLFPAEVKGREALEAYWQPVPGRFDGMRFPIEEIFPMEDPLLVVAKFKGVITLKNNAGTYNNDYFCLFRFNEQGQITEYHEYFNPVTVIRAFGLKDQL